MPHPSFAYEYVYELRADVCHVSVSTAVFDSSLLHCRCPVHIVLRYKHKYEEQLVQIRTATYTECSLACRPYEKLLFLLIYHQLFTSGVKTIKQ